MSDFITPSTDPFKEARQDNGVMKCPFQGEEIPMLLRHADVREAAKNWETYSSNAPFRVPIPSEEQVRAMRQLPIEVDPPLHKEYRSIVEPFFQRAKKPEMIAKVEALIRRMVTDACTNEEVEVVNEFALPIQSYALTYLLDVPESEAETWISWGMHVFKTSDGEFKTSNQLEDYLHAQFNRAEANPGKDFFSALTQTQFQGRKLNREEMMGFGNLTFAGGRDTIIHTISSIIAYFGENPEKLDFLRGDAKRIRLASEEFFRVFMPLTHIGRVCPETTSAHGVEVPANGRVSLCWNSANHDEQVFNHPETIQLDRKPNPHVSFGFGNHLCLGAPHARLITRTLLETLGSSISSIEIIDARPHIEREEKYCRHNGYESLAVKFRSKT